MMDSSEQEQLPDLEALESVETGTWAALPLLLVYGSFSLLMAAVLAWLGARYWQFLGASGRLMLGCVVVLAVWFVPRLLFSYGSVRTDGWGLTLRAALRRRSVAWSEVKGATARKSLTGYPVVALTLNTGKLTILPRGLGMASAGDVVTASIWQHLRQIGRAEGFVLPESALSLWEPVPEDVPAELDWEKPIPRGQKMGLSLTVLVFSAFAVLPWFVLPRNVPCMAMAAWSSLAFAALLKCMVLPEMTRRAWGVKIRDSGLEARLARGTVEIAWSEVASADWFGTYLRVRSSRDRAEVWIPYALGNKESEMLVLAAIRGLRAARVPQAVALPPLVSANPDVLLSGKLAGMPTQRRWQAYLNTLEEPARRRLRYLVALPIVCAMLAMMSGLALAFTDVIGGLLEHIYAGPGSGTRFFIPASSIGLAVIWLAPSAIVGAYAGYHLGRLLAGPYRAQWRKLMQMDSSPRLERILAPIAIALVLLAIAATPLAVDCYARVTDRGFVDNGFFQLRERLYPWSEVTSVEVRHVSVVDHGEANWKVRYAISFAGGRRWEIDPLDITPSRRADLARAVEFVAARADKPVRQTWPDE